MKPPTPNCALSKPPRESSVALKVTLSVVVIAASYSLLAWLLNIPHLLQINPSSPPMPQSTAVCFLLLSSTLFLGYFRRQINFARCCAVGCAIISALSVSQYTTGEGYGLDTLLILPFSSVNSGHVERMTLDSGLAFILSSLAFLTFARRNSFIRFLLAGVLVTLAATMSITALFVYALDLGSVEGLGGFGRMSPLSALCHELIALSLLAQIDICPLRNYPAISVTGTLRYPP